MLLLIPSKPEGYSRARRWVRLKSRFSAFVFSKEKNMITRNVHNITRHVPAVGLIVEMGNSGCSKSEQEPSTELEIALPIWGTENRHPPSKNGDIPRANSFSSREFTMRPGPPEMSNSTDYIFSCVC